MSPLLSVIMPVYNGEKYLAEAIESVLQQTFKDFEFIIVNDHSTDRTEEIIKKYQTANNAIILVNNEQNRGVSYALNTGLQRATGKYIIRADADDINLPDRFQIQYDFMEAHPEIAVSAGGYAPFNEMTQRATAYHPSNSVVLAWSFVSNTHFCHPAVIFRREIVPAVGEYPHQMSEDFAFFSKVLKKYRGYNLHRPLINFRQHPRSTTVIYREDVMQSVQNIYSENYIYYNGSDEGKEAFFAFQARRYLEWRNLFIVLKSNKRILRKIRTDYEISIFNGGHILTIVKICEFIIIGLLKSTLKLKR